MPWHNGNYPAAYQNQPVRLRQKAVEIANNLLRNGVDEASAIEMGLRKARDFFLSQRSQKRIDTELPAFP
ncbi:MAG TPA: hypothetical protein VL727_22025 [Puia sp.]|nr:hypothetical protein [Puia sp.]